MNRRLPRLPQLPPVLKDYPLQLLLLIPWLTLLVTAVGTVGYLSYRSGQQTVNQLAAELHDSLRRQVQLQIQHYLEIPKQVNQNNRNIIAQGRLDLNNPTQLERYFWQQMQVFPNLSYLSYGSETGEFIGVERLDPKTNTLRINQISKTSGLEQLQTYAITPQGERGRQIEVKPWNPKSEPWYYETAQQQQPIWGSIFQWQDNPEIMSLTANYPIFNPQHELQGVLSIDLTLTQFSDFLQSLPRDYQSKIFITEADGTLVASSQTQPIYQTQPIARRLRLDMLDDPIVQAIGKHYRQRGLFQATLQRNHRQKIRLNRETYYLDISPWEDPLGLHWLVFVITPEKTFMGNVHQSLQLSLLLGGLITLGTIGLSIFMTRQLTRPIRRLSEASEVIAAGDLSQVIAANWGSRELNDLAHAFEAMRLSLQNAQQSLANYAKSLENRVHERTAELEASNQHLSATLRELKSTQNQLVQSEKLAALGQLIASVAHEVNTPLGAIQSSIRNIVHCLETDLEMLPGVMHDLPSEYNDLFLALLQRSMDNMPAQAYRSSQEKRQLRRSIMPFLTEANIQNPDWVADSLIEMNVHESLPEFITLLQACPNPQILNLIYNLASAQKSAKTISRAASDAAEYVTALKTYTHNSENVTLTPVNLVDSLETAILMHQSQLQHRIAIERHYSHDAVMVLGVSRELQQIWSNLINNAIQAIEDHGLIQLSILTQPTSITVQIADNGCGIPAAIQPKLFQPFFTTKSAGEGTGLGLSIVKRLVENHRGQIAIKSEPGQTIVTVTLPTIPLPIASTKDSPPS